MAREKLSKEERVVKVRVVMKKVVGVLNTYFSQNPVRKRRRNELTMPALGMRLKRRRGRRGAVVSGVRRRRLAACPTIYTADDDSLKDTDGWNEWSTSCSMSATHTVASGDTVKIKKSAAMVGELVVDRGSATSGFNRHFAVEGTLEMEDVTLTGGYHAVSSFCSLHSF